jgi:hypothetical protein
VATSVTFSGPGNVVVPSSLVNVSRPHAVGGSVARLKITVPSKGQIAAKGGRVRKAAKSAPNAGTYLLKVRLSERAARKLQAKGVLKASAQISFLPSGAATVRTKVRLTFKAKARKKKQTHAEKTHRRANVLSAANGKGH